MDFSAKKLKEDQKEKQALLKAKAAPVQVTQRQFFSQSKDLKAFIATNKFNLYKSALNRHTSWQITTSGFSGRWWDNPEYIQYLQDRGFDIVDSDGDYFGIWFGEIHQLGDEDLVTVEKFLIDCLGVVKNLEEANNKSTIKAIVSSYSANPVKTINVLRLFVLFKRLDDVAVDFSELANILAETFSHLQAYLPAITACNLMGMTDRKELFLISWRFPREIIAQGETFTADTLNWLSSKDGNDAFIKLYEAIQAKSNSFKSSFEVGITTDENGYIKFLSEDLTEISIGLTPEEIKDIFETLDYSVKLAGKPSSRILEISWK